MLGVADYPAFVIAVIVFLAIPGPGNLALITSTGKGGRRAGPKAIVFYLAFLPLFVEPAQHRGLVTFASMAATIAVLTFLYAATVVVLTHRFAQRLRTSPRIAKALNRIAGTLLLGFGIKLALSR